MPPEMEATKLIVIAPPAIGSVAWVTLAEGDQLILGVMLLSIAAFLTLTLLPTMVRVMRRPFSPAHWSFGFPLAALGSALVLYADAFGAITLAYFGLIVLVAVTLLVVWLLIASAQSVVNH
jgi:tellurite resistance protein